MKADVGLWIAKINRRSLIESKAPKFAVPTIKFDEKEVGA